VSVGRRVCGGRGGAWRGGRSGRSACRTAGTGTDARRSESARALPARRTVRTATNSRATSTRMDALLHRHHRRHWRLPHRRNGGDCPTRKRRRPMRNWTRRTISGLFLCRKLHMFLGKSTKTAATRAALFLLQYAPNRLSAGASPQTPLWELTALPRPSSCI